jgi:lipopolysaccharide biosynthesis glycosyltransferase
MSENNKDYYEVLRRSALLQGELDYNLIVFGDELAKRQKYKEHKGVDALHFYLIEKYHWSLSYVRSLKLEDISFLLREEMRGWTLPKEAIFPRVK